MKVLIADDDAIPRRLLESALGRWGYEVVSAGDGEEAWRLLQEDDAPRLAILDWLMPGLDGVEVCRRLRARAAANAPYVYVILLTSRDSRDDVSEGMEAGADDYLTKPFDPHKLQVRLRAGRRIMELQAALLDSLVEVRRAEKELARAHERESEIGGKIQQTLLLGQPPRNAPGLRLAALTLPSQRIDGDFYDFFEHNDHCLDVLIGDVMGKGIPAALLGAAVKSHFLRALSQLLLLAEPGTLPAAEEIVTRVHHEVTGQFIGLESFATLCYARFEIGPGRLTFVDCGHTKTIRRERRTGACTFLEGESMPLGFSERETYRQQTVSFAPGDVFFFYSDGVTEAQNADGTLFGVDRLVEVLQSGGGQAHPQALIEDVRAAVVSFSGCDTFADDLTCVAVRVADAAETGGPGVLDIAGDLAELPRVRAFCRAAALEALDEEGLAQLELAVTEAASNIIRHAHRDRAGERIRIEADGATTPGRVSIRFRYGGEPFDPAAVPPPAFDGTREGGFGVYFIAQSVDSVRYTRDQAGHNLLTLEKSSKREPNDATDDGNDR